MESVPFRFQYALLLGSPRCPGDLGFYVLHDEQGCWVDSIAPGGPAARKNARISELSRHQELRDQVLRQGDLIKVVNGKQDLAGIRAELRGAQEVVHMCIHRHPPRASSPRVSLAEGGHRGVQEEGYDSTGTGGSSAHTASPLAATSSGEETVRRQSSADLDTGGEAVVIEDYDASQEPTPGYLDLLTGEVVHVYAKTRTAGDPTNAHTEYVYGYRRDNPNDQGWFPCDVLRAGAAEMQR
mmetsp:Transcript_89072/g.191135  ORF Transcript_89072/g.191135 Transcript_89072/m.191135 type:complete len:240 (+) Transcript_89072:75-794(+)